MKRRRVIQLYVPEEDLWILDWIDRQVYAREKWLGGRPSRSAEILSLLRDGLTKTTTTSLINQLQTESPMQIAINEVPEFFAFLEAAYHQQATIQTDTDYIERSGELARIFLPNKMIFITATVESLEALVASINFSQATDKFKEEIELSWHNFKKEDADASSEQA